MPLVKNHTFLDSGINMEDKSKLQLEIANIFLQTSINDQRPKLSMHINNIVVLLDRGVNVTIITQLYMIEKYPRIA